VLLVANGSSKVASACETAALCIVICIEVSVNVHFNFKSEQVVYTQISPAQSRSAELQICRSVSPLSSGYNPCAVVYRAVITFKVTYRCVPGSSVKYAGNVAYSVACCSRKKPKLSDRVINLQVCIVSIVIARCTGFSSRYNISFNSFDTEFVKHTVHRYEMVFHTSGYAVEISYRFLCLNEQVIVQ